jgi:hypothetical protein
LARYRFTATLVFFLLLAGYHCPHITIDKYVKALTDFKPTDGKDWVDTELQLSPELVLGFRGKVGRIINFEKMCEWSCPSRFTISNLKRPFLSIADNANEDISQCDL